MIEKFGEAFCSNGGKKRVDGGKKSACKEIRVEGKRKNEQRMRTGRES